MERKFLDWAGDLLVKVPFPQPRGIFSFRPHTKFQDSLTKGRVWGYKRPVGQAEGVSVTLALRINLLWSGHIAAET